jgi:serine phosphatase RsbU (regulator of sigma subunit)
VTTALESALQPMSDRAPRRRAAVTLSHDFRRPTNAREAGGDAVVATEHPDGTTAVLVADVSAKGAEGMAFASSLSILFQLLSLHVASPTRILQYLNAFLCDAFVDPLRGLFASAFVCRLFPTQSHVVYANAGGEAGIVFNPNGQLDLLSHNGMVLGVSSSPSYDDRYVRLDRDDVVVLHTDGIADAHRRKAPERVGSNGIISGLSRAVRPGARLDASSVLAAIEGPDGCQYRDDASLVLIRLV